MTLFGTEAPPKIQKSLFHHCEWDNSHSTPEPVNESTDMKTLDSFALL